jgi:hypothetical protein
MATTSQYLQQLLKDKEALVESLVIKGVNAFNNETFTSLAQKVKTIKPRLQEKTVNPVEKGIDVTFDGSIYEGLKTVTINPIKANMINGLTTDNIKKGVKILDITGTYGGTSQAKYVTPSTEQQIIKPDEDIEFLSQVIVQPVTSAIDDDIAPKNIRKGVNVLGVEGTFEGDFFFQTKDVSAKPLEDTIVVPDYGYDALESVKIAGVTPDIDSMIQPGNIKKDVTILGVKGTYAPDPSMDNKYITPTLYQQTIYPDEGYSYFDKVTIRAVDSSIDSDLKASNIREGVSVLGVTGSLKELLGAEAYVSPSTELQIILPKESEGKNAITKVTVNPVDNTIDTNIISGNIKQGVSILGVEGTYTGPSKLQDKVSAASHEDIVITADSDYDALSSVTITKVDTEDITVNPSMEEKTYERSTDKFINTVTVTPVTAEVDANIRPENIKQNMSILGVVGSYTGEPQTYYSTLNKSGSSSSCGIIKCIIDVPPTTVITTGYGTFSTLTSLKRVPDLDYSALKDCSYMFHQCSGIKDTSGAVNFKSITNAVYMFQQSGITSLDCSTWDMTNASNFNQFCNTCSSLVTLNVSNWQNSKGLYMNGFVWQCKNFKNLIANNAWVKAAYCGTMFQFCESLVELDLSWLYNTSDINMVSMFDRCSSLQKIDMRNFDLTLISSGNCTDMFKRVPIACLIIVKDDASKEWMNTNFANYTNVKTVAEYEEASA